MVIPMSKYAKDGQQYYDMNVDLETKFLYDLRLLFANDGVERYNYDYIHPESSKMPRDFATPFR